MDEFDIPIFQKIYKLYGKINNIRPNINKADRYTIWQRVENTTLDMLETILLASQTPADEKLPLLRLASGKLNILRILIRLSKDTRSIDAKKYLTLQTQIDEVGRMLGGWLRSSKSPPPPILFGENNQLISSSVT